MNRERNKFIFSSFWKLYLKSTCWQKGLKKKLYGFSSFSHPRVEAKNWILYKTFISVHLLWLRGIWWLCVFMLGILIMFIVYFNSQCLCWEDSYIIFPRQFQFVFIKISSLNAFHFLILAYCGLEVVLDNRSEVFIAFQWLCPDKAESAISCSVLQELSFRKIKGPPTSSRCLATYFPCILLTHVMCEVESLFLWPLWSSALLCNG